MATDEPSLTGETTCFEIRLRGRLETRWLVWFDGLAMTHDPDGTTVLRGHLTDQTALHGVLLRLRDLGLPLVSVSPLDPTDDDCHPGDTHPNGEPT